MIIYERCLTTEARTGLFAPIASQFWYLQVIEGGIPPHPLQNTPCSQAAGELGTLGGKSICYTVG